MVRNDIASVSSAPIQQSRIGVSAQTRWEYLHGVTGITCVIYMACPIRFAFWPRRKACSGYDGDSRDNNKKIKKYETDFVISFAINALVFGCWVRDKSRVVC